MTKNTGKVSQVIGPVVDVTFRNTESEIYPIFMTRLKSQRENGEKLILECQQHIGEDTVRAISMETTDGISRGTPVTSTGAPIKMPAGELIKGRVFNVIGDAIDGMENLKNLMVFQFTENHQNLKIYLQLLKSYLQVLK